MISMQSRWGNIMASLTVRNLDESVKNSLRLRASQHGCSMEEEVRQILTEVVQPSLPRGLAFVQRVQQRFAGLGAQALPIPARRPGRTPPDWTAP
jgi:plasmid stability protein